MAPKATDNTARLAKAIELLNENQEKLTLLVEKLLKADQNKAEQLVNGIEPNTEDANGGDCQKLEKASELAKRAAAEALSQLFPTPERMAAMLQPLLTGLECGGGIGRLNRRIYSALFTKDSGPSIDPEPGIDPIIVLMPLPVPLKVSWGLHLHPLNTEASSQLKLQWPSAATLLKSGYFFTPLTEFEFERECFRSRVFPGAIVKFAKASLLHPLGFGLSWKIQHKRHNSVLSLPLLAFVFSQLTPPPDKDEDLNRDAAGNILRFLKDLAIRKPSRYVLIILPVTSSPKWVQFSYYTRTFRVMRDPSPFVSPLSEGLKYYRQIAHFLSVDNEIEFSLEETRYSIAMIARCDQRDPPVNWIYVLDPQAREIENSLEDLQDANKVKLQKRPETAGFVVFQIEINNLLNCGRKDWTEVLDNIDKVFQVEILDICDPKRRDTFMFDDGFKRSHFRYCMENLRLENRSLPHFDHSSYQTLRLNWEALASYQQETGKFLLDRIDRKTKEVESLRDGLFNASQVREATKATQFNQYILVFTITTVVYLPMSFVVSFFGMHLFDKVNLKQTQISFYITIALISMVTWIISAAFIWGVDRRQKLRENWKKIWDKSVQLTNEKEKVSKGKEKEQDVEGGITGQL